MFIKDTEAYLSFLEDLKKVPDDVIQNPTSFMSRVNLSAEFRENTLWTSMMLFVKDFVYWLDSEPMLVLVEGLNPMGFDVNTLDQLEEVIFNIAALQRSEGYSDEEEAHFTAKIICSFLSALVHYQFGFAYSFPKALKAGSASAVGIQFPSGREFSFYAYCKRLINLLESLRAAGESPEKFNGMTKDFIRAMLRAETNWDLRELPLYQEWYQGLSLNEQRQAETYLNNADKLASVSISLQEENADSAPLVFTYYCKDLLLDLFDGSLATKGQEIGLPLPFRQFRFTNWKGLDELVFIKIRSLASNGLIPADNPGLFQIGDQVRLRLSGLLHASLNITSQTQCTFLFPTNRFSLWISPFDHQQSQGFVERFGTYLEDVDAFSEAVFSNLLNARKFESNTIKVGAEIQTAHRQALHRLLFIEQKHQPGDTLNKLSLAKAIVNEYTAGNVAIEQPEMIFATRRSPCYFIDGELRGHNQAGEAVFEPCVLLCMDWVVSRLFSPMFQLEDPTGVFDSKQYSIDGLPSFSFDGAFSAQIFSFPAQKKWLMRLHEPDNGVHLNDEEFIPGEPGRFVEHHVAFWVKDGKLMASFASYVSHSHKNQNVYRGSCIGLLSLLRQNGYALRNGGVFDSRPVVCQTTSDVQSAAAQLKRTLGSVPTIVCVYRDALDSVRELMDLTRSQIPGFIKADRRFFASEDWQNFQQHQYAQEDEAWHLHSKQLHALMQLVWNCAYKARLVLVPEELLAAFVKTSGLFAAKETLSLYCSKEGKPQFTLSMEEFYKAPKEGSFLILDAIINHLQDSDKFEAGFHYHEALEMEINEEKEMLTANEQWQSYHNHKINLILDQHTRTVEQNKKVFEKKLADYHSRNMAMQERLDAFNTLLAEGEQRKMDQTESSKMIAALESTLREKELRLAYLEALKRRPQNFEGLEAWLDEEFTDTLILTPRARREIKGIAPAAFNLPLLCDCLEFLAKEYQDELQGRITMQELKQSCEIKYGRLFVVTPNKSGLKGEFSEQYQVLWQGRKRELDLHLGVGNTAPHLIRIYFFYDTDLKQIIIGSLPDHLDTGI